MKDAEPKDKEENAEDKEAKEAAKPKAEPKPKVSKKELLAKIKKADKELKEKYLEEGAFVYELYAVMIHSGGAMGGHYFAYIKDLETDKWYNFNDSVVREIDVVDLVESFGPEPIETVPGKRVNMAAKRMAASRTSNAYMLMYRLVDLKEDKTELQVHEDEIPGEVKLDVQESETKQQQVRVEREKKSQRMQLKVVHRPETKVLGPEADVEIQQKVFYVDRREDTYATFFDMVYKDFIGDDNPSGKKRENFRLRAYNVQYQIMLDTYTGRENETLEVLKIYPMKTLALEEKTDDEVFEEYDPDSMVVKVSMWREGLVSLSEDALKPTHTKIRKDLQMSVFQ